jgi:hypothetical protein
MACLAVADFESLSNIKSAIWQWSELARPVRALLEKRSDGLSRFC